VLFSCGNKKVEERHEDGTLKAEYHLDQKGLYHGTYKKYYPSGQLQEESTYTKNVITGKRTIYYPSGQVEIEEFYNQQGLMEGPYRSYHEDGTLKLEKEYINNQITGILRVYYPSGKIKEEVTMSENEENGPFTEYYENGAIQWKGTYLNGDNEFGKLEEFDSLGNLIKVMQCDSMAICRTSWRAMPAK
jgi:antitoxin component YwqK of YwqJK toxin-antitoxin module